MHIILYISALLYANRVMTIENMEVIANYSIKIRIKRWNTDQNYYIMKFKKHGEIFSIKLTKDDSILTSNFKSYEIDKYGERKQINHKSKLLKGKTKDFDAVVILDKDNIPQAFFRSSEYDYYLEPAWRHIPTITNKSILIGYKTNSSDQFGFSLGISNFNPAQSLLIEPNPSNITFRLKKRDAKAELFQKFRVSKKYTKPTKTHCPLLLVADWRFFRAIGNNDVQNTINYLIGVIARMNAIFTTTPFPSRNRPEVVLSGYGFVVRQIVIHREPNLDNEENKMAASSAEGYRHYNDPRGRWSVAKFLENFSLHRPIIESPRSSPYKLDICLAHLFTHQPFPNNVLGLAYVASDKPYRPGGICTGPHYPLSSIQNGHRRVPIFLNTGFSSYQNEALRTIFTQEADIVTAHEFGHSWGSEHDDPSRPRCLVTSALPDQQLFTPTSEERRSGSYLMFPFSLRGYAPNNRKFSPCSARAMGAVLEAKADSCFEEPFRTLETDPPTSEYSFCGNGVVEQGELCDAGWSVANTNSTLIDRRNIFRGVHSETRQRANGNKIEIILHFSPNVNDIAETILGLGPLGIPTGDSCCDRGCKFRPGASCSDRHSPCCSACKPASAGNVCRLSRDDSPCSLGGRCDGLSADCAVMTYRPRGTPCPDGTGYCSGVAGGCLPHCQFFGLSSCICKSPENTCLLCCQSDARDEDSCKPFVAPNETRPITLREGQPCHYGYCGKEGTCQREFSDQIAKIWNYIENIDINIFVKLVRDNLVGTVVLITALLWIPASLAVHYADVKRDEEIKKMQDWSSSKKKALIPSLPSTRITQVDPRIVKRHMSKKLDQRPKPISTTSTQFVF